LRTVTVQATVGAERVRPNGDEDMHAAPSPNREAAGDGVVVLVTAAARAALRKARSIHAAAVREHLIGPLGADDRTRLTAASGRLGAGASASSDSTLGKYQR